jgi:antitoxin component YwqK of YwqJK toxin-antitoxin module
MHINLSKLPDEIVNTIYKKVMEELISTLTPIYYTDILLYEQANTPGYHIIYIKPLYTNRPYFSLTKLIFKNGRKWSFVNDKLRWTSTNNFGFNNGFIQEYYSNGNLKQEVNYINFRKNGLEKLFHRNGNLKRESFLKDNVCEGVKKEYYSNGKHKSETPYKNRKRHGIQINYFPNGTIASKIEFNKGIYVKTIMTAPYIKDPKELRNGPYKSFHKNGQLHVDAFYLNGKRIRTTKIYKDDGTMLKQINH